MRLVYLIGVYIAITALLTCCATDGQVIVDWDKSHLDRGNQIDKLIIIAPEFGYAEGELNSTSIIDREENKRRYINHLSDAAKHNEINLKILQLNDLQEPMKPYFNTLSILKRHLINMNFYQTSDIDEKKSNGYYRVPSRFAKKLPIIDPKFAQLAKETGTPYFGSSVCIIDNTKFIKFNRGNTLLLHIIVNVETGKTIFREVREVIGYPTDSRLKNALYDSYNILKNTKALKKS